MSFQIYGTSLTLFLVLSISACTANPHGPKRPIALANTDQSAQLVNTSSLRQTKTRSLQRGLYASTGIGVSTLSPNNRQAPQWTVTDKQDYSGQITLGADFNDQFAAELHSADLGHANVSLASTNQQGKIHYQVLGVSALWYIGKNRDRIVRRGLTGFGRLGYVKLDNTASGDASFRQVNNEQWLIGAGVEFNSKSGLGLRAEYVSVDKDAHYTQLALIYRFAASRNTKRKLTSALPEADAEETEIHTADTLTEPKIAAAVTPSIDSDSDGVVDEKDKCNKTKHNLITDVHGCAVVDGALQGASFDTSVNTLSLATKFALDKASDIIKQHPDSIVSVLAHTDSRGSNSFNQTLSQARAEAVVAYLVSTGIDPSRFIVKAFGETRPIASNDTALGRSQNRRVELELSRSEKR